MKWSIAGLIVLGVAAAFAAAMLVNTLRMGGQLGIAPKPVETVVLKAARPLPVMSVIDANAIEQQTVPRDQAPAESYSIPLQIVGKVLRVPMTAGQPFTRDCFAQGAGVTVATNLPDGKRAVAVSLSDYSALEGVLYSGSVVDVLVSLKVPTSEPGKDEAISTTLLERVPVLAVDEDIAGAQQAANANASESKQGAKAQQRRRQPLVTLMVDAADAEALQLAATHGTILLTLRNPNDLGPTTSNFTLLTELSQNYHERLLRKTRAAALANGPATQPGDSLALGSPATQPAPFQAASVEPQTTWDVKWEIAVIRGRDVEVHSFSAPETASPVASRNPTSD